MVTHGDVAVGFCASHIDAKLEANSQVIYRKVITNAGGAYDVNTGVFTCPIKGLYSFTVGALSTPDNSLVLDLYVNGRYLISIHANDKQSHPSGSRTIVAECKQGEKVNVKNRVAERQKQFIKDVGDSAKDVTSQCRHHGLPSGSCVESAVDIEQQLDVVAVGFCATHIDAKLEANSQVIYRKVITNAGGAYDANTGVFTCPIKGLYSFTVGALSTPDNTLVLDLYVNGRNLISIHANDKTSHPSGSRTIVTECKQGEKVNVVNRAAVTAYSTSDANYEHNIFSGFLIEPTI
ncbi:hypothetical protein Btru_038462 [Bulinus truncatus]|nr:hypothetical protein Btru_038462 [Bulinus truncatus]